ncbi:transcriptional regulator [Camelimonas fluminis]|uniref:MarR family winged helix-turn-helix transcriptional regulator n=1 Tax=Camelimonas fluminis TaxID=1576911 RepID=A0ABV7UEZ9_9HYPH|nr:MarR family transcriptional regulator [Camelimonas fluminis]GHE50732.1 transcriptional regulator [Camelimonas fluminis]
MNIRASLPPAGAAPGPMPLDEQLCFGLYAASMAITRLYKPTLDRLGITYPQFLVLQALHEHEGRTIGQIAARLGLESSTITPLVKRLEAAGLAERARNPQDERQVSVRLTAQGHERWAQTGCLAPLVMARCNVEPAALAALNGEIRRLLDALNAGEAQQDSAPPDDTDARVRR